MKLTTKQIQQIIKEELNNVLYENRKGLPKGVSAESLVSKLLSTFKKKKPSFFSRKKEPTKLEATLTKARIKHLFRFKFRGNEVERDFASKWIDIFYKDYKEFKKIVDSNVILKAQLTLDTNIKPYYGDAVGSIDTTKNDPYANLPSMDLIDYDRDRGIFQQERERAKKVRSAAQKQLDQKIEDIEDNKKNMQNASLPGFDFGYAYIYYGNFKGANLRGAYLSKARLTGINFEGADLRLAKITTAKTVHRAIFNRADLSRSNLSGTTFNGTDFIEAKLNKANLKDSQVQYANLSRADLSQANLEGCRISVGTLDGTNFGKANLRNCKFYRCDLRGANFKDAILKGTFFDESEYDDTTIWPANFKPERRKAVKK